MFIPTINQMTDKAEIIAFMTRFSFATIVNNAAGVPVATHLPFQVTERDGQVVLTAHFAKANDQWQEIEKGRSLVIFNEPHAYVSPRHYENQLQVPTWNYVAVHAYGQATLITDPAAVMKVLEDTILTYEAGYLQQWSGLPDSFRQKMMNGLVAFEIVVDDLQAKKKLSQNKTVQEQKSIIRELSASEDTNAVVTAEYMQREIPRE
ncbi:FMN-binding negative transcriptional regulator [Chitinophaga sp. 212800010-3]|uniref:FMN-binding negative transcriptional regulator n=1 Tax=unclassified Chitinophaga TaxID=2619133 RepID=UPI002DEA361C|nr:Transcriptional regulator [Chitinophaga sp. 212800010-3]